MPTNQFRGFDGRSRVIPDTVELSDLDAARREGIRRAGAALVLDAHVIGPETDWHMDVTHGAGTLLF